MPNFRDCFYYEYQLNIFYDDPIPAFKLIGYNQVIPPPFRIPELPSLPFLNLLNMGSKL